MKVIRHVVYDNTKAATIVLDVAPGTKTAFMYLAVCSGDNFSRKLGVEIATSRDPVLFFKLKSLDNFKNRALAAVLNEMFIDPDSYEGRQVLNGSRWETFNLLRAFLKGLNSGKTRF